MQFATYLFTRLGSTLTTGNTLLAGTPATGGDGLFRDSVSLYYLDSFVRLTAATVGVSVDIPIRFLKKTT